MLLVKSRGQLIIAPETNEGAGPVKKRRSCGCLVAKLKSNTLKKNNA